MCDAHQAGSRHQEIRGLKTAWLEAGPQARPILLLLHGFPDTSASWDLQIAAFASDFHVIVPDVRGAGASAGSADVRRYGRQAIALDLLAILDTVDATRAKPVYIIGHDLGAVHGWHLAALLRARAQGLVIINGLTIGQMARRWRRPLQVAKSWYIAAMQLPVVPEMLLARFSPAFLQMAYARGGLAPKLRPKLRNAVKATLGPFNQYRAFMREAPRSLSAGIAGEEQVACPVLVLWGADDAFVLPPTQAELRGKASRLKVRILAGNHWLHREQAERVNALIRDFFASPPAEHL